MKKLIYLFKIFFLLMVQTNVSLSLIQNKIIANVENQIVSNYELETKIRRSLFFSNKELNQNNINQVKNRALRSLIDTKLKKQEIIKYKINLDEIKRINEYFDDMAKKYKTDLKGLKKLFVKKGLNFELYKEETQINFAWNKIIYDIYKNKINVDEKVIDKELNQFVVNQKNMEEYELAEIEILLDNNESDANKIKEVLEEINLIGFENAAIKYSVASSADNGGNIGWVNSKSLSGKISSLIKDMEPGYITKPIYEPNSALLIKLLNKRGLNINNLNLKEIRTKIISAKTNEVLNLFSNNHLSKIKNNAFIKIK
jgi:peptidyl-prolyl cis-trans isomerase SurA